MRDFYSEESAQKRDKVERAQKMHQMYIMMKRNVQISNQFSLKLLNPDHGDVLDEKSRLRFDPRYDLPNAMQKVVSDFKEMNYTITGFRSILNPVLQAKFLEPGHFPVLCYHGTNVENFPSIRERGLLVPGQGNELKVVNGSAFGKGIYLATKPNISLGYVRGASEMIVAAASIGNKFVSTDTGQVLVITNSDHVLPMFIVSFTNGPSANEVKAEKNHDED